MSETFDPFSPIVKDYVDSLGYSIEWPTEIELAADYEHLLADLMQFENDPVGFTYYSFPWGEEGTPLANFKGPEDWQLEILELIRDGIIDVNEAIVRISIRSGHGIGKSAMVSILILWAMLKPDMRGVVTANSERQLRTKTWAELGKWFSMYIGKDLFRLTATSLFPADRSRLLTWRIDMIPWSEHNSTAFQGLHNQGNRILIIFDEASEIPKVIWETASGALSDANTQIVWFAAGNPTENSGEFFNIHQEGPFDPDTGESLNPWITRAIDSRTVSFTNKKELERKIKADPDGLESDIIRVRILGEFPRSGFTTFISRAEVMEAMSREIPEGMSNFPVILGVDVARFGKANSVVFPRQGRDARSLPYHSVHGNDTMQVVDLVLKCMQIYQAEIVAVDGGGVGGGVIDRLRQLNIDVIEVQFGSKATPHLAEGNREKARYFNKRAEIWGAARDWMRGGALTAAPQLLEALCGPKQKISTEDVIQLESKLDATERMEKEGLVFDMDVADAFCITFAPGTEYIESFLQRKAQQSGAVSTSGVDYNPYEGFLSFI